MIHFNRRIQGESQNKKDIRKIYYRIISYGQSEISVFCYNLSVRYSIIFRSDSKYIINKYLKLYTCYVNYDVYGKKKLLKDERHKNTFS